MLLALFYESKLSLIQYLLSIGIMMLSFTAHIQLPIIIILSFVHFLFVLRMFQLQ